MVFNEQGDILLIRRGKSPHYGRWMIPGGSLEWGETLEAAAVREVREETGIDVAIESFLEVVEAVSTDDEGFHFVIMDYAARAIGGVLKAGSDALAAEWVKIEDLTARDLTPDLKRVIERACRATNRPGP